MSECTPKNASTACEIYTKLGELQSSLHGTPMKLKCKQRKCGEQFPPHTKPMRGNKTKSENRAAE